jgi:hypothetical protein
MDEHICIVCMGRLKPEKLVAFAAVADDAVPPVAAAEAGAALGDKTTASSTTIPEDLTVLDSSLTIATISPCGHALHDECLKPWVERANSCPICRQKFNLVTISEYLGGMHPNISTISEYKLTNLCLGPRISQYDVEDKTQAPVIDPTILDLFPEDIDEEPCQVCHRNENPELTLICDSCDRPYHTYCVWIDEVPPGDWFCDTCSFPHLQRRPPNSSSSRTRFAPTPTWVHSRLASRRAGRNRRWENDIVDDDDDDMEDLNDAEQGIPARTRISVNSYELPARLINTRNSPFDAIRASLLASRSRRIPSSARLSAPASASEQETEDSPKETPEEASSWNAFETAKQIELDAQAGVPKGARSITKSPREPIIAQPERKLKRPRTRRAEDFAESSPVAVESPGQRSTKRIRTSEPESGFISSILKVVEASNLPEYETGTSRNSNAQSPTANGNPALSPNPQTSPTPSNHPSPRQASASPVISPLSHSAPLRLSSDIRPRYPVANYVPEPVQRSTSPSKQHTSDGNNGTTEMNGQVESSKTSSATGSDDDKDKEDTHKAEEKRTPRVKPNFRVKNIVVDMVRKELRPFLRSKEISEGDFENINRTVSRGLYSEIGETTVSEEELRSAWQSIAKDRVDHAVHDSSLREPLPTAVS